MKDKSKCYASGIGECSSDISKEHYISKNLLDQLSNNGAVKVSGLKFQSKQTFDKIAVSRLVSKILCRKHNNSLSYLDASMGEFHRAIIGYDRNFTEKKFDSEVMEISGTNIEGIAN